MKPTPIVILFLTITLHLISNLGFAQTLRICTKSASPFSMKSAAGEWTGLSVYLWQEIAQKQGYEYQIKETSLEGLIDNLSENCDVSLGALTITADRERKIDFSHAYMNSGIGLAVPRQATGSMFDTLRGLFTWQFFAAVFSLGFLLFMVGLLLWAVERRKNAEQFGGSPLEGIGSGFWWSAVTMTTVGYGDKAPTTLAGRFVGLIWMFASVIIISTFTAAIASSLTVQNLNSGIEKPEDLKGAAVGTIENSASANHLRKRGISFRAFTTLDEALQAMADGRLEAVIYDKPLLQWIRTSASSSYPISILPFELTRQSYGLALPKDSPIREQVNISLLEVLASPGWKAKLEESFGE